MRIVSARCARNGPHRKPFCCRAELANVSWDRGTESETAAGMPDHLAGSRGEQAAEPRPHIHRVVGAARVAPRRQPTSTNTTRTASPAIQSRMAQGKDRLLSRAGCGGLHLRRSLGRVLHAKSRHYGNAPAAVEIWHGRNVIPPLWPRKSIRGIALPSRRARAAANASHTRCGERVVRALWRSRHTCRYCITAKVK